MDPQQILDRFYLGDFAHVAEHIDEVQDETLIEEKLNIKKLLDEDDTDTKLIKRILDLRTGVSERRKAWVDLRSRNSGLAEAQYALGMCNLDGDLAHRPDELTEFSYTLQKLNTYQSPPARALRMLYLIAGSRIDLVPAEFTNISASGDSGIPEIAQIWYQFATGASEAALESCNEVEQFFGEHSSERASTKHMQSLRAVCALHAGLYAEVEKYIDTSNVADLINLAAAQANLLELEHAETTLALIKSHLPQEHPYLQPLAVLEAL